MIYARKHTALSDTIKAAQARGMIRTMTQATVRPCQSKITMDRNGDCASHEQLFPASSFSA